MAKYASLQDRLVRLSCSCDFGWGTPCLIWDGYTQKDGYVSNKEGYGKINLTREGKSLKFAVHRVSKVLDEILTIKPSFNFYNMSDKESFFDLYDAYSLSRLTIDHLCKNSLCLKSSHLEWVYISPNQQRKKWSQQKRKQRLLLNEKRITRHHHLVVKSQTVQALIKKIKEKKYRIIK